MYDNYVCYFRLINKKKLLINNRFISYDFDKFM